MKYVAGFIVVVILCLVSFLSYMGAFAKITVTNKDLGPFKIVCKDFKGAYGKTGPVFDEIQAFLSKECFLDAKRGIGFYYDDPSKIKIQELRSKVGSIIEPEDYDKLKNVAGKYEIVDFPVSKAVVAEFPIKNMLSYMIGPMKVYPILAKNIDSAIMEQYSIEIYDMPSKKLQYAFIEKQKAVVTQQK